MAADSFAATRARSRLGMAMAEMIPMIGIITKDTAPRMMPAMAMPRPQYVSGSLLVRLYAMAPRTMARTPPMMKQPKLGMARMPRIMAAMAMPLLCPPPLAARRAPRAPRGWP